MRTLAYTIACIGVSSTLYAQQTRYILQDLNPGEGVSSTAVAINDAGVVTGRIEISRATRAAQARPGRPFELAPHAFLYTDDGGMVDLNTLIDPGSGWILNAAWGINNAGEIVGQGTYGTEVNPRGFKLTPRPVDTTPPEISAVTADPTSLWPANLQMVSVTVTVTVTDNVDPAPSCRIAGVTSNEVVDAEAIEITGDLTLKLRAQRIATSTGRIYQIAVSCADASGNSASRTVEVRVPHDLGGGHE